MSGSRFARTLAAVVVLATVYFIAAKVGLRLAIVNPSASAVWPPTGIALAAILVLGYRVWPGILLGAFLANFTTAGSAATSLGIAMGNTLEAVAGAYLVNRFAGGRQVFEREQNIFKFAALAGLGATQLSATVGVTTLVLGGLANWANYRSIWSTWWLGDATGALVMTPVLVLWSAKPFPQWKLRRDSEAAGMLLGLLLVGQCVFGGLIPSDVQDYPLEFLCIPFLLWAAFRFSARQAATATLLLSVIAIWGTTHGHGPFARETPNESLLLLQAFMAVTSIMTLALAAVVSQKQQIEDALRQLAVSDSLTGLANHRRFTEVLAEEIERSRRTGRPFAVLLLDLDNLKRVNDEHGHLVGSRALCRLANILKVSCRSTDTAARFGGDEFGMVLVETEAAAARLAARRIREQLVADSEKPALSASVGVAIYPHDGDTIEKLLQVADSDMYKMKGSTGAPEVRRLGTP